MKNSSVILLLLGLFSQSCGINSANANKEKLKNPIQKDTHTHSNCDEVRTIHLHLDLDVNFKEKTIYGVARHQISKHSCDTIIFDIKCI